MPSSSKERKRKNSTMQEDDISLRAEWAKKKVRMNQHFVHQCFKLLCVFNVYRNKS
jgi:hypothetical protein